MFKNRTSAVIGGIGIAALLIMILALILGSQGGAAVVTAPTPAAGSAEEFMATNAQDPDVTVTASGLQYRVIETGDGAQPTASSTVTVNYEGRLTDGTVFDSGESVTFPLARVIDGWTEGLQLMNVGSKYTFYIPAELAYGANPPTPAIPPNAPLVFDVELLAVQ